MTLLWGFLRMLWLRGLSTVAGAWLSPMLTAAIAGVGAVALAVGIYALWPSAGNRVEEAVLDALGRREIITNANIDEEKRDNAWLEEWEKNTASEREAAARASGASADRVIWRADDAWLRAKRAAKDR